MPSMYDVTEKKCPFRMNNSATWPLNGEHCVGPLCAWWLDSVKDCAVPLMAGILADNWKGGQER